MIEQSKMYELYKSLFHTVIASPEQQFSDEKNILQLAQDDPREFQNLISIYESLPEHDNIKIEDKLFLSELLIKLNYTPCEDFLFRVLDDERANQENKLVAACNLIKLGLFEGKDFLLDLEPTMFRDEITLAAECLEISTNEMGIEFFLYLEEKYDFVTSELNISYFENKLRGITNKVADEFAQFCWQGFYPSEAMENVEALARSSKKEFNNLVRLFNEYEDRDKKSHLAKVLVRLGYRRART